MTKKNISTDRVEWPLIGMTLDEAAAALRVNARTLSDMLNQGAFPGRKVGVSWRIEPDAVKAWLAQGMGKAQDGND